MANKKANRYADAGYAVGKGKPPAHSRFQKGQSGNPKGAPKKASLRAQVKQGMQNGLEELVTIRTSDGGAQQVPAVVAMFLKVRNKVIETGSPRQFREFLNIARDFEVLTPEQVEQVRGVLVVPRPCATSEEWEQEYGGDKLRTYQEKIKAEWNANRN